MAKNLVKGPADGAMGGLTFFVAVGFACACSAVGFLVDMVMPMFDGIRASTAQTTVSASGLVSPATPFATDSPWYLRPSLIIGILVVLALLYLATSIGIFLGRNWGFRFGVVLYGILLLVGHGIGMFGLAGAVYCVLRLNGFLGHRAIPSDGATG